MSADPTRLDRLSPERRALLAKRLRGLAAGLAAGAGDGPEPGAAASAPGGGGEPLAPRAASPAGGGEPLSPAQLRLWRVVQAEPRRALYNLFHVVRLSGRLRYPALAAALAHLVARHEALRMRFVESAAGPEVRIDPAHEPASGPGTAAASGIVAAPLPRIDLGALAEPRARRAAERALAELAERRFDLARGPLLRAALLRVAPAEHALVLVVHHIVIDAWSLTVLVRELAAAYAAASAGAPRGAAGDVAVRRDSGPAAAATAARREPSPSPVASPPALQAGDFTAWQARRLRAGEVDGEVAWWRQRLAGAPAGGMQWPLRGRPEAAGAAGGRASLVLDAAWAAPLRELARRERVTLFVLALAAWKALLLHRGGERDVLVGTVMAWRGRPETAGLVGLLLNHLVLRTDLGGDPTFVELLGRVRETAFEAFAHEQVPFEHLAAALLPAAGGAGLPPAPWIRGVVNMPLGEAAHAAPLSAAGLEIAPVLTGETGSELDWTLHAREDDGGIRFDFGHAPGLFAPGEAAALLDELGALLAAAAADPRLRLSLLTPAPPAAATFAGAAAVGGLRPLEV
jgi:hypothetical protein